MKKIVILACAVLMSSCKSVGDNTTGATSNKPQNTYEEKLDQRASGLLSDIASGDEEARYKLAELYVSSYKQEKRKLAEPLLRKLADDGNKKAVEYLSLLEYRGALGYVSDKMLIQNKDLKDKKFKEKYDSYLDLKNSVSQLIDTNFSAAKTVYDKNFHLCEQPVSNSMQTLEHNANAHLSMSYYMLCLKNHSVKNSRERFLAIAEYEDLLPSKETNKIPVSLGYRLLSNSLYTSNEKELLAVTYVLRGIFLNNLDYLYSWKLKNKNSLSSDSSDIASQAYRKYVEDHQNDAINLLVAYLNNEKNLKPYDIAYIQAFIVRIEGGRNKGNESNIFKYGESALASKLLMPVDETAVVQVLGDRYLVNKEFAKYIDLVGNYILRNQGDMDLVPAESIRRAKELLQPATKS